MTKLVAEEPSLKDVFDIAKRDTMLSTNCHAIAKIASFDPLTQTCTASIVYSKTYLVRDAVGQYVSELVEYPALIDCPVIVLSGGTSGLTMPISEGDDCFIMFNDRDIDNWFKGATSGKVATPRVHSFSDCIALVGLNSLSSSIADYDPLNLVLYNGDNKLTLKPQKMKLENSTESFGVILQDLITAINAIVTTDGASVNTASQIALTAIAVRLGGLLE